MIIEKRLYEYDYMKIKPQNNDKTAGQNDLFFL